MLEVAADWHEPMIPWHIMRLSIPRANEQLFCLTTETVFSALMLLVGQPERYPACKISATTIPKNSLLGTGLTWSNLIWSYSGKTGQTKSLWSTVFIDKSNIREDVNYLNHGVG